MEKTGMLIQAGAAARRRGHVDFRRMRLCLIVLFLFECVLIQCGSAFGQPSKPQSSGNPGGTQPVEQEIKRWLTGRGIKWEVEDQAVPVNRRPVSRIVISGDSKLRPSEFGKLRVLNQLKMIVLTDRAISAETVKELTRLPNARSLTLDGPVTATALKTLAESRSLQFLRLRRTKLTTDGLHAIARIRELRWLDLEGLELSDPDLAPLVEASKLRQLNLKRTRIADAGLDHLSKIKSLRHVHLYRTSVTADGAARLRRQIPGCTVGISDALEPTVPVRERALTAWLKTKGAYWVKGRLLQFHRDLDEAALTPSDLRRLRFLGPVRVMDLRGVRYLDDIRFADVPAWKEAQVLNLAGLRLTGSGLSRIGDFSGLVELNLAGNPLTDDGLKHLAALPALQSLQLSSTQITSDGLAEVGRLTSLTSLHLNRTKITSAGLEHLRSLRSLETVSVRDSLVDDEGLEHLESLSKLQFVDLSRTHVTRRGVARLAEALPECRVYVYEFNRKK